ncbi:MAG: hypothetical protein ACOCXJ_03045 [Planctomycetota bacterium]
MHPQRAQLLGSPHCYYLTAECALAQPLLSDQNDAQELAQLIADLQQAGDLSIYALSIQADGYAMVLQHRASLHDSEDGLRARWQRFGGSHVTQESVAAIQARLCSLSGLMQTLGGRFSRRWHERHGGRGSIWARRYRACLLADDSAILAAACWLERSSSDSVLLSRRDPLPVRIVPPAVVALVHGTVMVQDEGVLGMLTPGLDQQQKLYLRYRDSLSEEALHNYRNGFARSWAIGRPESLSEALARLGRSSGRGRSRRPHELEDPLGLCGIWG